MIIVIGLHVIALYMDVILPVVFDWFVPILKELIYWYNVTPSICILKEQIPFFGVTNNLGE